MESSTKVAIKRHLRTKNIAKASPITRKENRKERKKRRYRQIAYFISNSDEKEKVTNTPPELELDETPGEDGNNGKKTVRTEEEPSDSSSNDPPWWYTQTNQTNNSPKKKNGRKR